VQPPVLKTSFTTPILSAHLSHIFRYFIGWPLESSPPPFGFKWSFAFISAFFEIKEVKIKEKEY
jgi:hypothetical protein